MQAWREVCASCGRVWGIDEGRWLCSCGGLLDMTCPPVDPLPRYAAALPPGAGVTDATPAVEVGDGTYVKADFLQGTGSFKDRGAAAMIGMAAGIGVRSVVVDSSGNAGRAVAAYASQAGMACTVFVPAGADPSKLQAAGDSGAEVVEVPGGRSAAAAAAQARVGASGDWYASHVYQPAFHHGVKTLAFELHEQLPDVAAVVVPAGNGTLVLGLWLGFRLLLAAGRTDRLPAIVAVQAERCAPLLGMLPAGEPTAATGIAVADPPRAAQVRAAVAGSGGRFVAVGEDDLHGAVVELIGLGFDVEPTGAAAWAGRRGAPRSPVAVVLTGR